MVTTPAVPAPLRPRSVFSILVLLIGSAGILAVFLPFVEGVSPLAVMMDIGKDPGFFEVRELAWLAAPFFLAPLLIVAMLRWIASGTLSKGERVAMWVLAVAAAVSFFMGFTRLGFHELITNGDSDLWQFSLLAFLVVLSLLPLGGLGLAMWLRRHAGAALPPIVAMETTFISNALGCLWIFGDSRYQQGAYCTMVAVGALLVHTVGASAAAWHARAKVAATSEEA